jgi:hypothetical protein
MRQVDRFMVRLGGVIVISTLYGSTFQFGVQRRFLSIKSLQFLEVARKYGPENAKFTYFFGVIGFFRRFASILVW